MRRLAVIFLGIAATAIAALSAAPAQAHGFSSTVYAHVDGQLRTTVELEYDLFIVSVADDPLFLEGTPAFESGDATAQAAALNNHKPAAFGYATRHFTVSAGGTACTPTQSGDFTMGERDGVPYTTLVVDWACIGDDYELTSTLFPDEDGYVKGTKTIVDYDIAGHSGSAALDAAHPSFSTGQSWYARFGEFFVLGAEHLLFGIDHILFLLALIAGSRRLREIVLAATSFTLAHSVTFLLAALGLVDVPGSVVEPVIALSIAVVAAWGLLKRPAAVEEGGLDRAGWIRLGVVFCFGLVHGLGFAGALGIDEAWSWTLLWSLLVFNVGIEVVQLSIIAVVFPLLLVLRRRAPRAGRWVTGGISAGVSVMGLIWFVQRVTGG